VTQFTLKCSPFLASSRVQRVVLEGGTNPPAILGGVSHGQRPLKEIKKGAVRDVNIMGIPSDPMAAMWVPLDRVLETNMGTGVVKIWNLTKKSWEKGNEN